MEDDEHGGAGGDGRRDVLEHAQAAGVGAEARDLDQAAGGGRGGRRGADQARDDEGDDREGRQRGTPAPREGRRDQGTHALSPSPRGRNVPEMFRKFRPMLGSTGTIVKYGTASAQPAGSVALNPTYTAWPAAAHTTSTPANPA